MHTVTSGRGAVPCPFLLEEETLTVFSTRYRRLMEDKLRRQERKEDKLRDEAGTRFTNPAPPLLIRFQQDTGKLPRGFPIQLPHDTAIAAIHRGRSVALPVGSFDAVPDLEISDEEGRFEGAGIFCPVSCVDLNNPSNGNPSIDEPSNRQKRGVLLYPNNPTKRKIHFVENYFIIIIAESSHSTRSCCPASNLTKDTSEDGIDWHASIFSRWSPLALPCCCP